jgi:hypothetical protein
VVENGIAANAPRGISGARVPGAYGIGRLFFTASTHNLIIWGIWSVLRPLLIDLADTAHANRRKTSSWSFVSIATCETPRRRNEIAFSRTPSV